MKDLPAFLTIPAALIWIATRDFQACQEAFETAEALHRHPFAKEDAKVTVWVPVQNFGLTAVSCIIAKYLHPGDRTIRDKWGTFEVLDDDRVLLKGKKRDTAAIDYEYALAERELLRALSARNITAYTVHADNTMHEINAALWPEREFKDDKGKDGHYHVVAVAADHEPLRSTRFKKEDIFQRWPPEGGQKRGPKTGRPTDKDDWCRMAIEILESRKVLPGRGDITKIAKLILEKGRYPHALRTITKAIAPTVHEWKKKHAKAA